MEHYICTGGCGGVSDEPGVCQDADCPRHGEPLEYCACGQPDNHKKEETE